MTFFVISRYKFAVFVLFIGLIVVASIVGGVLAIVADKAVVILTLMSVGKDLKFV